MKREISSHIGTERNLNETNFANGLNAEDIVERHDYPHHEAARIKYSNVSEY